MQSQSLYFRLKEIFNHQNLLLDPADCWVYGYDNSRRQALPQAVVFVTQSEQITALISLCNEYSIPLTPRGRSTGTSGGSVPHRGGIVCSFERMQRIIEINPADRIAVVEPGVINAVLQQKLAPLGFFWPPDPSSAEFCSIGGNLAVNCAGPGAVKYGTCRDNTLGLKAITGAAQEICCGVRTTKGVVGYDLTRLIIGSEGTLALITQATLRLTPLPETKRTLRALYRDMHSAAAAVAAIMAQPVIPCAVEFIDAAALRLVQEQIDLAIPASTGAMLMLEVDGSAACIHQSAEAVAAAAAVPGLLECKVAANAAEVAQLWLARKALSPALRKLAPKKINEDVVVPVSQLPVFIEQLAILGQQHSVNIVNFGHAGNGNIHVNLLVNPDNPPELAQAEMCLQAVFDLVLQLGGTISGEHGIGLVKRDFVNREITPNTLALMHALKRQFDPNGILNPGKALPD